MKFCPKCGTQLPQEAQFCNHCGTQVPAEQQPMMPNNQFGTVPPPQYYPLTSPPAKPMKWFNYQIYFALIIGAVGFFINGIVYVVLSIMEIPISVTDLSIYEVCKAELQICDITYGALMLVSGVFMLYTRQLLAKFKKDGPMCFYVLHMVTSIISALVGFVRCMILFNCGLYNGTLYDIVLAFVPTFVFEAIFIFLNVKYFNNRKELFRN